MSEAGFAGAPVSRYLMLALFAASLLSFSTTPPGQAPGAPPPPPPSTLLGRLAHTAGYAHAASLIFALVTLYNMRRVERLWGSSRFATFQALLLPPALLLPHLLTLLTHTPPASGASATILLWAMLAQYYALVPPGWSYASTALAAPAPAADGLAPPDASIKVGSKWPEYLAAGQVALAQGWQSAAMAGAGWTLGWVWRAGMAVALRHRMRSASRPPPSLSSEREAGNEGSGGQGSSTGVANAGEGGSEAARRR